MVTNQSEAYGGADWFQRELDLGHHSEIVPQLLSEIDAEPLNQRRWAQLMLALYRSGRLVEALRTYQRLSELLKLEYGLEPSNWLHDLDRAIALQSPDLDWTEPGSST